MTAKQAVITFSGRTYANEDEALADLERLINAAILASTADLVTALDDALSIYRNDDKAVLITAERQEAWRAVLDRHKPATNPEPESP